MANRFLLCLVFLCAINNYIECGRSFGRSSFGRSHGSRSSSSGWGRSWGSSSASKPSYNSHSSSSYSKPKYPSSSSGLSGYGSSAPKYPSSSSGLSGYGSSAPKYPSSSSGLSGYGSSPPKYPSSTSGLSGFGSSAPKYPSSSSGLSGFGSSAPKYPSSSSGLSGFGSSASKYPSSSSGTSGFGSLPKYPSSSSGLSGSGSSLPKYPSSSTGLSGPGNVNKPHGARYYENNKSGYGSGNSYTSHNNVHRSHSPVYTHGSFINSPSYYTVPQHVYITEYRNSGSRYGDLLTGLALYNLGRSHHHYHDHFYSDDYYRRRYYSSGSTSTSYEKPKDEAYCTLRIKENGKVEILKIPCEIVSTFTEGSKKMTSDKVTQTVCVSNYTIINNTRRVSTSTTEASKNLTINRITESFVKNEFTTLPTVENKSTVKSNSISLSDKLMNRLLNTSMNDILIGKFNLDSSLSTVDSNNQLPEISKNNTFDKLTQNECKSNCTHINDTLSVLTTAPSTDVLVNVSSIIENSTSQNSSLNTSANNISTNVTQTEATKSMTNPVSSTPRNISNGTSTNVNISSSIPQLLGSDNSTFTIVPNATTLKPAAVPITVTSPINTSHVTTTNTTTCIETTDPLTAKGPPLNVRNMECEVDIITKDSHVLRSKVDCNTLLQYAKMPEPKKESNTILPTRDKLKSWLSNPPWWMSLFIAV